MTGDLRTLPKAHLHLHLTGAMRPATLAELAADRGMVLPAPMAGAQARSWAQFQGYYDAARAVLRSPADVARVIAEAAADDAADGCGWLEIQVDPTAYAPALGGLRGALEAVLVGARAAPVPAAVIVASSWARPPSHAEELATLAAEYADAGVVGFGLSNDERRGTVAEFTRAFRIAAEAGLLGTPHAGFHTGPDHVRECVDALGARRLGHGTAAAGDPAVLDLLAARGVTLEVCPTSYPPFGVHTLAEVPVAVLTRAGVPVALASDDPLLFGTGLAGQYAICRDVLGLSDPDLAELARHGVRASAAPDVTRARLLGDIDAWLEG